MLSLAPRPLYSRENSAGTGQQEVGGLQKGSGRFEEEKLLHLG